nr:hypothetical protein [Tanacetum cinerariifolium]
VEVAERIVGPGVAHGYGAGHGGAAKHHFIAAGQGGGGPVELPIGPGHGKAGEGSGAAFQQQALAYVPKG